MHLSTVLPGERFAFAAGEAKLRLFYCVNLGNITGRLDDASCEVRAELSRTTGVLAMKRLVAGIVAVALIGLVSPAIAADATGTWKWTTTFNNQTRESTLKLKQEGDKLSGAYVGGQSNTETPIEDASIKGDAVSFKVTRERNGQKFTTKYSGTLKDDSITGKSERERDGQTQSSDWVAKRQK